MATRIDTGRFDANNDGVFEQVTTDTFEFVGDKLASLSHRTERPAEGVNDFTRTDYGYDAFGRNTVETDWSDHDGFGLRYDGTLWREFRPDGKVAGESLQSPDFGGDGAPDYITNINYSYTGSGMLALKVQTFLSHGEPSPWDTVTETWSYDTAGRLSKYVVDDPGLYDDIITQTYRYNKAGLLQDIKTSDWIRFGDERPRITDSYTYEKDGDPATHTQWAGYGKYGYAQRIDDKYFHGNNYEATLTTHDREGDFDYEAAEYREEWKNADGHVTDILTSIDADGNGGHLWAGGISNTFDSRNLDHFEWNGDFLVSSFSDTGADGSHEFVFDSVLV